MTPPVFPSRAQRRKQLKASTPVRYAAPRLAVRPTAHLGADLALQHLILGAGEARRRRRLGTWEAGSGSAMATCFSSPEAFGAFFQVWKRKSPPKGWKPTNYTECATECATRVNKILVPVERAPVLPDRFDSASRSASRSASADVRASRPQRPRSVASLVAHNPP